MTVGRTRIFGRLVLGATLAILTLVAVPFLSNVAHVAAQSGPSRAIVAFSQAETDTAVSALIRRYDLQVEAVYLWNVGFTGAYRTYTPRPPGELLGHARQESIRLFTNATRSSQKTLESFTNTTSAADIAASEALAAQARSILNNYSQVRIALASAQHQVGVVYAIETVGASAAQLAALSGDPLVSGVAAKEGPSTAGALKPSSYQAEWRDPALAALSALEVYARMQELRSRASEERIR